MVLISLLLCVGKREKYSINTPLIIPCDVQLDLPSLTQTILNNKKIIIHYLTTWFTTDFISSIPFDYIVLTITNEEGDGNSVLAGTLRALR